MKRTIAVATLFLLSVVLAVSANVPVADPGPRGAPVGAGGFFKNINAAVLSGAQDGAKRFGELETFPTGLGPLYNSGPSGACSECHSQPQVGGSSPAANAFPNVGQNPQATVDYNAGGATNAIPPFITASGPVREMRLKYFRNADGSLNLNAPDGGVHDLYSVTGRSDATGCVVGQPHFDQELDLDNAVFRIPLPIFGDGLIENIDDATIMENHADNAGAKAALGISGHPNRSGNDGTITRFGWKAQNKSLLMFAGEAYNVEDGVTNELFPTQRPEPGHSLPPGCRTNTTPEDTSNPGMTGPAVNSDITAFASFMRMLDQPKPAPPTASTARGLVVFALAGCALCHTPSMTTATSTFDPALSNVQANLFSDLLVHNMGTGLADGVTQGNANGQEFRTAPLWGLGQRVFFLHDGRTSDLLKAILDHASSGSEANGSITLFNNLPASAQQNLLNFLRSL
jgi:mono/diheme cytochrome c family protein